jgi:hypothetical protein
MNGAKTFFFLGTACALIPRARGARLARLGRAPSRRELVRLAPRAAANRRAPPRAPPQRGLHVDVRARGSAAGRPAAGAVRRAAVGR